MVSTRNYCNIFTFVSIRYHFRFLLSRIGPDENHRPLTRENDNTSQRGILSSTCTPFNNMFFSLFRVSLRLLRTNSTLNVIKSNSRGVVKVKPTTMPANVWLFKTRTSMTLLSIGWSFVSPTETLRARLVRVYIEKIRPWYS